MKRRFNLFTFGIFLQSLFLEKSGKFFSYFYMLLQAFEPKHFKVQENIEPDSDGNYHVGDMILNPGQYQRVFGDPSTQIPVLDSGISDERFRWKDGGKSSYFVCI